MAEYNIPSDLVKELRFDEDARKKIISGVNQLGKAVASTMGASGLCVVYEDGLGKPNVTKDGVTVAEAVVLKDPVENIGATLVKQAAQNTVKEAGDATSASCVLSMNLLNVLEKNRHKGVRELKEGLESGLIKLNKALDSMKIDVTEELLERVATISANNDKALGKVIGDAYNAVGKDGVVMIEDSATNKTYSDVIDGVQIKSTLRSPYFMTDRGREVSELENPLVLIMESPLHNIRRIKIVLEEVARTNRPLLIIGNVEDKPMKVLMANHLEGNIKVNVIDPPAIRTIKRDILEDLAAITGAKVINESLGDDMDLIKLDMLGGAVIGDEQIGGIEKCVTSNRNTVLVTNGQTEELEARIELVKEKLKEETEPYHIRKLEERLAMLTGRVGVVFVGADSDVELKEKKDRVDDAVHATKAALNGGIVSGGGVALRDACEVLDEDNAGEAALKEAVMSPFYTILKNAGYYNYTHLSKVLPCTLNIFGRRIKAPSFVLNFLSRFGYSVYFGKGRGINAINGEVVNMIDAGIVDPLIAVKSSLKNSVSVVSTIISANSVISNMRVEQ